MRSVPWVPSINQLNLQQYRSSWRNWRRRSSGESMCSPMQSMSDATQWKLGNIKAQGSKRSVTKTTHLHAAWPLTFQAWMGHLQPLLKAFGDFSLCIRSKLEADNKRCFVLDGQDVGLVKHEKTDVKAVQRYWHSLQLVVIETATIDGRTKLQQAQPPKANMKRGSLVLEHLLYRKTPNDKGIFHLVFRALTQTQKCPQHLCIRGLIQEANWLQKQCMLPHDAVKCG